MGFRHSCLIYKHLVLWLVFLLGQCVWFVYVHIFSFRLAGPLALIIAVVTALVDYEVRTASVFATAALSVAHWAVLHQLQDGLLINDVLWSWSVVGKKRYLRNGNNTMLVWSVM